LTKPERHPTIGSAEDAPRRRLRAPARGIKNPAASPQETFLVNLDLLRE
jgi:hypothetical protein